jgi:hypothetical protein
MINEIFMKAKDKYNELLMDYNIKMKKFIIDNMQAINLERAKYLFIL